MGYRAHIVKEYKVKFAEGGFYNHQVSEFGEFLDKLGVSYYFDDDLSLTEISSNDLLKLSEEKLSQLNLDKDDTYLALSLIKTAKEAKYAKNGGFVRVEWF